MVPSTTVCRRGLYRLPLALWTHMGRYISHLHVTAYLILYTAGWVLPCFCLHTASACLCRTALILPMCHSYKCEAFIEGYDHFGQDSCELFDVEAINRWNAGNAGAGGGAGVGGWGGCQAGG